MLAEALLILTALTPQQKLDAAKARWAKFHARDYSYVVTPTCSRCAVPPARIRVRAGKPVGTPKDYRSLDTVPELFEYIQMAIDSKPYRIDLRFGPRSGVPTLVSVDAEKLVVDDVGGFALTGFRRDHDS